MYTVRDLKVEAISFQQEAVTAELEKICTIYLLKNKFYTA